MQKQKVRFFGDTLGLAPFPIRFRQALTALFGEEDVPASKFGLSSLKQLYPAISPRMWRGKPYIKNKVIISNLYNHTQTPIEEGWSVKRTQIRDFRGGQLTYNSHNGTDFAIPIGTTVCTAAAGKVVAILSQYNRGGLKIFIDHGNGLMTCYAHLAKSTVQVNDVLKRGQPIAISGYSGIDGTVTFPFGIPHVHFNAWLNGEPIDPFAHNNEVSIWASGALPLPPDNSIVNYTPSVYNTTKVDEAISYCKTPTVRKRLMSIMDVSERAVHTIIEMNYYPTRFIQRLNVYEKTYPRAAMLDLPFDKSDFNGVVFLDEVLAAN